MKMTDTKTTKTTASKAAPKKTAAPKTTVTKKLVAKKAPAVKKTTIKKTKPSAEAIYKMTEVAAYYIALKNGFAGNPSDYWIEAEAQIRTIYK
jgi:hypothetical protein